MREVLRSIEILLCVEETKAIGTAQLWILKYPSNSEAVFELSGLYLIPFGDFPNYYLYKHFLV